MIEHIQQADEGGEVHRETKREQAAIVDGDQMPSWKEVFLYTQRESASYHFLIRDGIFCVSARCRRSPVSLNSGKNQTAARSRAYWSPQ